MSNFDIVMAAIRSIHELATDGDAQSVAALKVTYSKQASLNGDVSDVGDRLPTLDEFGAVMRKRFNMMGMSA